jgi:hypothetical protein
MNRCVESKWEAEASQKAAMAWLQCMADAYQWGIIVPGPGLDPETRDNVVREMTEFFNRTLPRLHEAFGTSPLRKATYHLSPPEVSNG